MIDIFTDGSTTNNSRTSFESMGGIGVYIPKYPKLNIKEPFYLFPITNQRCEFYACISALKIIIVKKRKKKIKIRIITDSKHVIDTMTKWVDGWIKKGWKKSDGKTPTNLDLIYCLYNLTKQYQNEIEITYKHVKAHRKEPDESTDEYYMWYGNYMADEFANMGREKCV
tara:strand:- start:1288 stop:1794 length:507 start_codon:yes stop_codon:yes gene_type:complete